MAGRPQGLKLDPSSPQPVIQEPVQLRARDRLGVPIDVADGAPWMAKRRAGEFFALAVLEEPGKITLRSWEADSNPVLEERKRLIEAADFDALRLLEDKYRRVQVAKDARVTLTLSHILHLGLQIDTDAYVYVSLVGHVVEIVSVAYRNGQLARATSIFPQLP